MPKLTQRWIDAAKPSGLDRVHWDDALPGFGIRISQSGRKAFVVQYRNAQGRSRRITIGPYGPYTPAQARGEAERLLREARASRNGLGEDPSEKRQHARQAVTFKTLVDEYLAKAERGLIIGRGGRPKKRGTVVIDRYRAKHLTQYFGAKLVREITRRDCQRCLEYLIEGKHGAARTFGFLGGLMSYALAEGQISDNPARGVRKPADGRRDFSMSNEEWRSLGRSLEEAKANGELWQAIAAIRLLALTGCRKGEILGLRWAEVDFSGHSLRLGDSKTGASVRPIGDAALQLLEELKFWPDRFEGEYVFHGVRLPRKSFNGLGGRNYGAWGRIVGADYTAHSLRHAFASMAGELGYSELTIAALLGHSRATVTAGYVRLDRVLVAAADHVSSTVSAAMTEQAGEVVKFRHPDDWRTRSGRGDGTSGR